MKTLSGILCFSFFLFAGSLQCMAQVDPVGIVKSVSGEVFLTSSQSTTRATPNMLINQGDSIKTGTKSSIGLIFTDDSVVSLGPNSEMSIQNFLFNPVDQELSFVVRLVQGTFSFITGQIAKLAPKNVKLLTPDATLGVRGTKLLVKID